MSDKQIKARIKDFTGDWSKETAGKMFVAVKELIQRGYEPDDAIEFVEGIYRAAASDYGA